MRSNYIILVALTAIFSTVLLLGCSEHSSTSEPVTIQGYVQESGVPAHGGGFYMVYR